MIFKSLLVEDKNYDTIVFEWLINIWVNKYTSFLLIIATSPVMYI